MSQADKMTAEEVWPTLPSPHLLPPCPLVKLKDSPLGSRGWAGYPGPAPGSAVGPPHLPFPHTHKQKQHWSWLEFSTCNLPDHFAPSPPPWS